MLQLPLMLPARSRLRVAAGALAVALVAAACSGTAASPRPSAAPSAAHSAAASPAASVNVGAEIDAVVAGLDDALAKYRAGNTQGALDAIAETYEQHFELVEGPLGEVDHDFMEKLEELIAVQTRAVIQEGKPVTDLETLVTQAKTLLAQAKTMLQ